MRPLLILLATVMFLCSEWARPEHAEGQPPDGALPRAGLTLSGSTLYGTTFRGGAHDFGTIFSINTDGTGYKILHEFAGPPADGALATSSLTQSGETLYGTTVLGGSECVDGCGTIFSIGTDGTGFTILHHFTPGSDDGALPSAALTLSGSTLFGTTNGGGERRREGTIFSLSTDGTGFKLLHEFGRRIPPDGGDDQGWYPSELTLGGSILYGTTRFGGLFDGGTVFSLNTDGTGFASLYDFRGGEPSEGVVLSGSTLFGTIPDLCDEACEAILPGLIFSMGIEGTQPIPLYEFAGGVDDGAFPIGNLTLSGPTLYGTTRLGGEMDAGTIFSINMDGTGFTLLYDFARESGDDILPNGGLLVSGSTLFERRNTEASSVLGQSTR